MKVEILCIISLVVTATLVVTVDNDTHGVIAPTKKDVFREKYEVQGGFWHVVSHGDTLQGIVKKYKKRGVWVRPDQIVLWNDGKIEDPDKIYPGEYLWIPYLVWYPEEGVASWYGPGFHGKLMANGEIFNMRSKRIAAHPYLPKEMKILVVNQDNGKWGTFKVKDRGPYVDGRVLDVSHGAAKELGFENAGLANVKIFPLG